MQKEEKKGKKQGTLIWFISLDKLHVHAISWFASKCVLIE